MQPRQKLIPLKVAGPLTMGAAILGSILGFGLVSALKPKPAQPVAETASSAAPSVEALAAPAPSAEAAADAGAADSGAASASDAAQDGAGPAPEVDLSDAGLKPYEAYLFVRSSASADVWVHGIKIGRTNQKLKLPCTTGLRFTRLGQDPGPAWISKPTSILIPCGSVTQVTLEPGDVELNPLPTSEGKPQPKKLPAAKITKDNPY